MKIKIILLIGVLFMSSFKVVIPQATTNLCTNPSFEENTTGWAAAGTNTIAQSTAQAFYELYSGLLTYGNTQNLLNFAITLPTGTTTYILHARVYIPANWDGGWVRLEGGNFAGSSIAYNATWEVGDATDQWTYIESLFTVAADVVGIIDLVTNSAPTAGRTLYLDGVQIERQSEATTYCDGSRDGCVWTGTEHGSTSSRSDISREGGIVKDIRTDYNFRIRGVPGAGAIPEQQHIQSYALAAGAQWKGVKDPPRQWAMTGVLAGCDLEGLHDERKDLVTAFSADGLGQAALVQYTGGTTEKEIKARYTDGLGFSQHSVGNEAIDLRLLSENPYWSSIGDQGGLLDHTLTIAVGNTLAKVNGVWNNMGNPANPDDVYAIVKGDDGLIYIGGEFTNLDGNADNDYITAYDPTDDSYTPLTTGMVGGRVWDIINLPEEDLYVMAGEFTSAGGVGNTRGIAMWNGAAWSAMGTGADDGFVYTIAVGPDGTIYAGGTFTGMGGVANTSRIAAWNGAAWTALGTGAADVNVQDIAVDQGTGFVYAGGDFTAMGGVANTARITYWNGTTWVTMGNANDDVSGILIHSNGLIYMGGLFTTIGGVSATRLAVWNGSIFTALEAADGQVFRLFEAPDGMIYACGTFTAIGDLTNVDAVARYNGYSWSHIGADLPAAAFTFVVSTFNQDPTILSNYDIYLGFTPAGNAIVSDTVTITNVGTAIFLPIITVNRSGGTGAEILTLRNETAGTELLFDYAMLDGETITIDLRFGREGIESSFFGSRPDILLKNSDFTEFALLPSRDNVISLFVGTAGGATIISKLWGRAAYKSFDD